CKLFNYSEQESKELKEGTSSQSKVKEGGGCECPTPNGDVIQVCKYKPSHVAKEIAEIQELILLLCDLLLI
ncbi:unnamed protein product, partial [Brassica rapa subsp. trilocularis]